MNTEVVSQLLVVLHTGNIMSSDADLQNVELGVGDSRLPLIGQGEMPVSGDIAFLVLYSLNTCIFRGAPGFFFFVYNIYASNPMVMAVGLYNKHLHLFVTSLRQARYEMERFHMSRHFRHQGNKQSQVNT